MTRAAAKTVIITGATSGIGLATATRLVRSGARVWAGYRAPADADRLRDLGATPIRLPTPRHSVLSR